MIAPETQRDLTLKALKGVLIESPALHPVFFAGVTPKETSKPTQVASFGKLSIGCPSVGRGVGIYLELNFVIGRDGLKVLEDGLPGLWKVNFAKQHGIPERLVTHQLKDDKFSVTLSLPQDVADCRAKISYKLPHLIELLEKAHQASPISLA